MFGLITKRRVKYDLQIVGVRDQAEKDEIVKSVMDLKNAEIEVGYTMDAVVSRQVMIEKFRGKSTYFAECFFHLQNLLSGCS